MHRLALIVSFPQVVKSLVHVWGTLIAHGNYHASDLHEMLVIKYQPTVRASLPWSQLSCVADRVYWVTAILWAMDELYPLLFIL